MAEALYVLENSCACKISPSWRWSFYRGLKTKNKQRQHAVHACESHDGSKVEMHALCHFQSKAVNVYLENNTKIIITEARKTCFLMQILKYTNAISLHQNLLVNINKLIILRTCETLLTGWACSVPYLQYIPYTFLTCIQINQIWQNIWFGHIWLTLPLESAWKHTT